MMQRLRKEDAEKIEIVDAGRAVPIYPTGTGLAGHMEGILLTFYFVPPEEENRMYVLARVGLTLGAAETLMNSLKEALEQTKKLAEGRKKKPSEKVEAKSDDG
jgi:hypothetical protein